MTYSYLKDSAFLKLIDKQLLKEKYIKLIVLDWKENPIKEIQGYATQGTLNLNGTSTLRRTCNLTVLIPNENKSNVKALLSINKKVKIQIGVKNLTNQYVNDDIIWFPLGLYVIYDSSIANSNGSNLTATLLLKDKMCLLNGDCGGKFESSITFNQYDVLNEDGEYVIENPTIYTIIKYLVKELGKEQEGKIFISDIDNRVKQVMKWTGSTPLYITSNSVNGVTQYSASLTYKENAKVYENNTDVGYIYTDFIYTSELIGDIGDNICTILDKIKTALGNYEYFYDVDGNFIFQEIKNYLNTSKATTDLTEMSANDYLMSVSMNKSVYQFDDSLLVKSYSNTPSYSKVKNNFLVWGVRTTSDGYERAIRYHLAIDKKPKVGNTYKVFFYEDADDGLTKAKKPIPYSKKEGFPKVGVDGEFYLDRETGLVYQWRAKDKAYNQFDCTLEDITTTDWRSELYLLGLSSDGLSLDSTDYYTELKNEWPKQYDLRNLKFYDEYIKDPTLLDYYLDFVDTNSEISELSIDNIGKRTETYDSDDINCIFEPDIPNLVLIDNSADPEDVAAARAECEAKGLDYIQVDGGIYAQLAGGGTANAAYEKIKELLYQYTSYNNSIVLQTIPIYYLEPNTRITVNNPDSDITGDYIISQISLPFDNSSCMTIQAQKALERF